MRPVSQRRISTEVGLFKELLGNCPQWQLDATSPAFKRERAWRGGPRYAGGGLLLGSCPHHLSIFRLLDMLRCAKFDPIVKLSVVVRSFRPLVTLQYHAAGEWSCAVCVGGLYLFEVIEYQGRWPPGWGGCIRRCTHVSSLPFQMTCSIFNSSKEDSISLSPKRRNHA